MTFFDDFNRRAVLSGTHTIMGGGENTRKKVAILPAIKNEERTLSMASMRTRSHSKFNIKKTNRL
jgi:hypothetical protein